MARQPATETGAWPSLSLATRLARIRADGAPGLADFRPALRGVPPGLPLGFLDGQIRGALSTAGASKAQDVQIENDLSNVLI